MLWVILLLCLFLGFSLFLFSSLSLFFLFILTLILLSLFIHTVIIFFFYSSFLIFFSLYLRSGGLGRGAELPSTMSKSTISVSGQALWGIVYLIYKIILYILKI